MKKWQYNDKHLKEIWKESKSPMSYEAFKKLAEEYANSLIKGVYEELEREKEMREM